MRKDMSKVIVERPRHLPSFAKEPKENKNYNEDTELPFHESMTAKHNRAYYGGKELNENLAPLQRYLESNLGKPWDDVFSDICKNINVNSAVQKHIRDHVKDYVATKTFIGTDGEVWHRDYNGSETSVNSHYRYHFYYVHPTTKVLEKAKYKKFKWKEQKDDPNKKIISDTLQCHKIEGIWYLLYLEKLPEYKETRTKDDVLNKTTWDGKFDVYLRLACRVMRPMKRFNNPLIDAYGSYSYCVRKVQCNKKDLKKYGLS